MARYEPENEADAHPPLRVVVPAFVLSELKTSFQMGFLLFLPFLVIDMVVASVLLSMGMFMLPPVMISTPFKILLFVLVDGWHLVCSVAGDLLRDELSARMSKLDLSDRRARARPADDHAAAGRARSCSSASSSASASACSRR